MVKVQVRPSSLTSGSSAWPGTTSLFSSMSSSGSKVVMMVLAPSIALFSAGSRVSGLGPYWTVKPLAEVPVASVASSVVASVLVEAAAVSVEAAEEPQAAKEAAMQPAIATAAMFFIFIGDFPPYKIYLPISTCEHLSAGERIHILYRTPPYIGNRYAVFVTLLKRKYAKLYQKCEYLCIFCTSSVDEVYILYFVRGRRTGLLQCKGRVVIQLRGKAPLQGSPDCRKSAL